MNSRTKKILAIVCIVLLIVGIGTVAAGKGEIVKDVAKIVVIDGVEHVITHAKEINKDVQKIKADNGVYDRHIELYERQIAKLQDERKACLDIINDPNEKKYNIEYAKDKLVRINANIKSFELKIEQCKRSNAAGA